ncbi:Acetylxylan esterase 2 [Scedosporium apiospermum]|uniref:Acetylxylan esterase 2 n=1 Tax=Pseudallescheria apiosperma TaxID=563466 RepID=A0A084FWR3_PSEDA|nr:Acetylxylan esterase 2 [Scedosporium apiospermum]KEZ39525.1 Acetylxylan esterase 2 [Scedosporium apiospermum]
MVSFTAAILLAAGALATPLEHEARQASCPPIHVFGARETTAPAGMGTAGPIVQAIVQAHPGATSEAIDYPACGGQGQCGGIQYGDSVKAGTAAVAKAVNAFNEKCPETQIVLIGYSQGGQIFDNAFCGGGDTHSGISDTAIPISEAAQKMVKAAIFCGDPRHIAGLAYAVGTCQASGFAPRPNGFECPYEDRVQLYCDATDPYCCNGNDANSHQQYGNKYRAQIMEFVNARLT